MGDKTLKQIRGQIRQVVKEILPDVLTQETFTKLQEGNKQYLEAIGSSIKKTLEDMEKRSKDTQAFIMKEVLSRSPAPPASTPLVSEQNDTKTE